jgi:protein TonB
MLMIVAAHVAVIAAVMSAKMDLPQRIFHPPTQVTLIPLRKDPPPPEPTRQQQAPRDSAFDQSIRVIPLPPAGHQTTDTPPPFPDFDQMIGARVDPLPPTDTRPQPPVTLGPRLLTPASELKPPYPPSKLASEEEAVLRLRLSIDESGRVVAVEPLGRADRAFLDAARRHVLAHWRYRPASEGGRAVASSMVITLQFHLEG